MPAAVVHREVWVDGRRMRPLVVFTGQGLSLADGFNLTERLKAEPGARRFFERVPAKVPLDDVFSATRAEGGDDEITRLARITRRICMEARALDRHRDQHRQVFRLLREAAGHRVILHLTTNIDGIATVVGVREFRAVWRPVGQEGAEVPVEEIRQDVQADALARLHSYLAGQRSTTPAPVVAPIRSRAR